MKKLVLLLAVVVVSFSAKAQEAQKALRDQKGQGTQFSATAGFTNIGVKAKDGDETDSVNDSGFFLGVSADIATSEKLHIQPSLLYANVDGANFLYIPVMVKYYVAKQFNLQAGPQGTLSLEESIDDFSNFGFAMGIGAGYDITDKFYVEARYAFELTNRRTGDSDDLSTKFNPLTVGVGYKFN